jgi:serine/threonine protein kinase
MPERLDQAAAAEAISDGTSVDWEGLEASTDPSVRGVVAQLRIIDALAAVHRAAALPGELDAWGPLTILERVGEGSFGTVYRAHDPRLARDVALKLLKEAASDSAALVVEEGRLLARVRHPNVITVHGADIAGGRAGLWMEFIHGETLEAIVRTGGPMGAGEAAAIGRVLCGALTAVHGAGLVHGDVKAQNVMREQDGRVVLMDFGAGREVVEDPPDAPLTGTPAYVAPELFDGGRPSAGTDLYALGVLLFHLVTGSYPTPGRSRTEVHAAAAARTRVRLRDLRADLPDAFVAAVEKAIAPDPSERFSSAAAFDRALAAIEGSRTTSAAGTTTTSRSTRRGAVLAGVLVLAIAAAVASLGRWRGASAAPPVLAPERSLAVLPIVNRTQDPAMEYLADGITESLIRELSLAKGLRVTSRTSSMWISRLNRRCAFRATISMWK